VARRSRRARGQGGRGPRREGVSAYGSRQVGRVGDGGRLGSAASPRGHGRCLHLSTPGGILASMADQPSTRTLQALSAGTGEEMTASGVSPEPPTSFPPTIRRRRIRRRQLRPQPTAGGRVQLQEPRWAELSPYGSPRSDPSASIQRPESPCPPCEPLGRGDGDLRQPGWSERKSPTSGDTLRDTQIEG
jgi:hypothetical protein